MKWCYKYNISCYLIGWYCVFNIADLQIFSHIAQFKYPVLIILYKWNLRLNSVTYTRDILFPLQVREVLGSQQEVDWLVCWFYLCQRIVEQPSPAVLWQVGMNLCYTWSASGVDVPSICSSMVDSVQRSYVPVNLHSLMVVGGGVLWSLLIALVGRCPVFINVSSLLGR